MYQFSPPRDFFAHGPNLIAQSTGKAPVKLEQKYRATDVKLGM